MRPRLTFAPIPSLEIAMKFSFYIRSRPGSPRVFMATWLPLFVAASAFSALATQGPISSVQEALKRERVHFGEVTGVLDEPTREALKTFQRRRELPITGEIDAATLQALQSATDAARPTVQSQPRPGKPNPATTVKDRAFLDELRKVESDRGAVALPEPVPPAGTPAAVVPASPSAPGAVTEMRPPPPQSAPLVTPPTAAIPPPDPTAPPAQPAPPAPAEPPANRVALVQPPPIVPPRPAASISPQTTPPKPIEPIAEVTTRPSEKNRPQTTSISAPLPRTRSSAPVVQRYSDVDPPLILSSRPAAPPTSSRHPPQTHSLEEREALDSGGTRITRTISTGRDGRQMIIERKTTTYSGTPIPVRRAQAVRPQVKGGTFFDRLFADDDND